MRRAAAFLLLAFLGWLASGVAGAGAGGGAPQQMATMPISETNVLAECDGFQVLDHVTGELSVTVSFGKDGQVERFVTETSGRHDIRNSVSGVAVVSKFHRRFTHDVDKGRTQIVGPQYHVTVPGHGSVMFETGLITFENGAIKQSGRHDMMGGDMGALCPAFA